jgi:hypothetical protein
MRTFPSGGDKPDKVFYTPNEHQQAMDAAVDRETYLAIRAGAHSLRRQSIVGAPLSGLRKIATDYGDIHLLRVRAKDSSDRPEQTVERDVFFSDTLVQDIYDYHGRDYDGAIFSGQKSTLNDRYRETRKAVATQTGNEDWFNFTPHDGRRYFASHALFRHGLDPELVMQLGGWNSLKALQPYMMIPEDVMAQKFGSLGLLTSFDTEGGTPPTPTYRVNHALETIQGAAISDDGPTDLSERELAGEVAKQFTDDVLDANDVGSRIDSPSGSASDAGTENRQGSLREFADDDQAVSGPAATAQAAKATYVTCLVYLAWIISFGPIA